MHRQSPDILIIGSGFGGLSAAAQLAHAGYRVTVVEKNEQVGGRASVWKKDGYTFDMGPSWYMMPEVFERFFESVGRKASDYYQLDRLGPSYRVRFDDRSQYDFFSDFSKDAATFDQIEPGAADKVTAYLAEGKLKYEAGLEHVLYENIDSVWDFLKPELFALGRNTQMLGSMRSNVRKYIQHPKLTSILEYLSVFIGGSPQITPALYSLINYTDFGLGVWYPQGGIGAVIDGFRKVCEEEGVEIICDAAVTQLEVDGGRVVAVHTADQVHRPKAVVANAARPHIESLLSDQHYRELSERKWQKKIFSPSGFLLYLGIDDPLPDLLHHTLLFREGAAWDQHFKQVFDAPEWPTAPSVYINKPSATDPTLAPKGKSAVMVLVPAANGLSETQSSREQYAQFVLKYMAEAFGIDLRQNIEVQRIFSVSDFTERYNAYRGNALGGLANTLMQSVFLRPKNQSTKIPNLFYSGANTVPGIGMPPAIISGHLVTEKVRAFLSQLA